MLLQGAAAGIAPLLIVCTGNICRSPYLERRLRHELGDSAGIPPECIASAGTRAVVGTEMAPESRELLARRQGDPEPFAARQLDKAMVEGARLIITMTRAHRTAVARLDPRSMGRTFVLLDLVRLVPQLTVPPMFGESGEPPTLGRWLEVVTPELAPLRSRVPPLPEQRSGVVDPIGRGHEAFTMMAAQVEVAVPHLIRLLTPAVTGAQAR